MSVNFHAINAAGEVVLPVNHEDDRWLMDQPEDENGDLPENPNFRPETYINVTAGNGIRVGKLLGMETDDECWVGTKDLRGLLDQCLGMVHNATAEVYASQLAARIAIFTALAIERGAVEVYAA